MSAPAVRYAAHMTTAASVSLIIAGALVLGFVIALFAAGDRVPPTADLGVRPTNYPRTTPPSRPSPPSMHRAGSPVVASQSSTVDDLTTYLLLDAAIHHDHHDHDCGSSGGSDYDGGDSGGGDCGGGD